MSVIEWSEEQNRAICAIRDWLKDPSADPLFKLFGYAGTGKTTLALHLSELQDAQVGFAAFTGKAAQVMRNKGCLGASTLHQLIYDFSPAPKQLIDEMKNKIDALPKDADNKKELEAELRRLKQPRFRLRDPEQESGYEQESNRRPGPWDMGLIIVDECSMVDRQLGMDLLSYGTKVLVLGDDGQLPPVRGQGFFNDSPDFQLTGIMRQQEDSPIIRLATMARMGSKIKHGDYGDGCKKTSFKRADDLLAADQVLVGMHRTRNDYTADFRKDITSTLPVSGEKIVCRRNNHEEGLLNGSMWKVVRRSVSKNDLFRAEIQSLDDPNLAISTYAFTEPFERYIERDELIDFPRDVANLFEFGYVLTVHSSQGSQWDNVVVRDESGAFRDAQKKWLYTAITRAAKSITIIGR